MMIEMANQDWLEMFYEFDNTIDISQFSISYNEIVDYDGDNRKLFVDFFAKKGYKVQIRFDKYGGTKVVSMYSPMGNMMCRMPYRIKRGMFGGFYKPSEISRVSVMVLRNLEKFPKEKYERINLKTTMIEAIEKKIAKIKENKSNNYDEVDAFNRNYGNRLLMSWAKSNISIVDVENYTKISDEINDLESTKRKIERA